MKQYRVMRTLGREHKILQVLADEKEHRKRDFGEMLDLSSMALDRLLIYGLAKRTPKDVTKRGTYSITKLGAKAFIELEDAQSLSETTGEMLRSTTVIDGQRVVLSGQRYVAQRGYKRVVCEVDTDMDWLMHFDERVW